MTDKRQAIRQGDILLVPIPGLGSSTKYQVVPPEDGRHILARGEVTGHHHSIAIHDRIALFREDGSGGGLFLMAGVPTVLEHQEHTALEVPAGSWAVLRQRTVSSSGRAQMVAD